MKMIIEAIAIGYRITKASEVAQSVGIVLTVGIG